MRDRVVGNYTAIRVFIAAYGLVVGHEPETQIKLRVWKFDMHKIAGRAAVVPASFF